MVKGRPFRSGKVEVVVCRSCGKRTTSGIEGHVHDAAVEYGYFWPRGCEQCRADAATKTG